MRTDPAVAAWAKALFTLAEADGTVEKVDAELKAAVDTIRGHLGLKEALADTGLPASKKAAVLYEVFGESVSPLVANAVLTIVATGRQALLPQVHDAYEAVSEEARNVAIADVTTAIELDDALRDKLRKQIAAVAGKNVVLRERVDPEILGGVIVRVGGKIMDGSVKAKLAKLKEQMVGARGEA